MRPPRRVLTLVTMLIALVAAVTIERQRATDTADRAASGELVRSQVSSRSVTVRTEEGERSFVMGDGATIHEGVKTIALADLSSAVGHRVKIWYRETRGIRTARNIRVLPSTVSEERPDAGSSER